MAYFHFRFVDYFSNFATNDVRSLQICRLLLEFCYQWRAFTLDLSIISRILLLMAYFHFRFVDYFSNFATNDVLSLQICRLLLEFCYQRRAFTSDLSIISRILQPMAYFHFRFVDYFSNFATNGVLSLQICRLFLEFYYQRRVSLQMCRSFLQFCSQWRVSLQISRLSLEFCYHRRVFTLDLSTISRILLPTACFHFRFADYFSNFATNGVLSLQLFSIISRILLPTACFHFRFADYFSNFTTNGVLSLQICRLFLEFCYQRRAFTLDLPIIARILLPTACFHFRFVDYFSNFATNGVLSLQICRLFLEFYYQRRAFTLDLSIIARILLPTTCFHFRFADYFSNFATNGVLSLQISRLLFSNFATNDVLSLKICRLFLKFCYQRRAFTSDLSIISPILLPTACFHFRFVDYFSNFATNGVLSLQICRLFLQFCSQRRAFTSDLSIISRILLPTACFHFRFVDYFSNFATNGVLSLQISRLLFSNFATNDVLSLQTCR